MKPSFTIRAKLLLVFGLAMGLVLSLLVGYVYLRVSDIARGLLEANAAETASRFASVVKGRVEASLVTAKTLALVLEDSANEPAARRREIVDARIRGLLERTPEALSVWTTWEPDALDGLDAANRGGSLGNDAGRFDATWYRAADDSLRRKISPEAEIAASDYYQEPKRSNAQTVVGPYRYAYEEGGTEILMTSVIAPIQGRDTAFKGVVGIDLAQSAIQVIVQGIKPYGTGFAVLYAKDGLIAGHPEEGRLGQKLEDEAVLFSPEDFQLYKDAVTAGKDALVSVTREGRRSYVAAANFRLGSSYTRWTLAVIVPEASVLAASNEFIVVLAGAGLVALVLVLLLIFLVSGWVSGQVRRVSAAIKEVSAGEGDLSRRLALSARDETGELAGHFNDFVCALEATVARLKRVARDGASLGDELAANGEELSASVVELEATVRSLQTKISGLDASIGKVDGAVAGIGVRIDEVGGLVARQSAAVAAFKEATGAIAAEVGRMSAAARERGEGAASLAREAREGEAVVGGVLADVKAIGGSAERIAEMAALINDVSERTNLLAMNAAIEAAHAGERGKGFAVVADEIRKLAEATGRNAGVIAEQLRAVTSMIDKTAAGAEKAGGTIRSITRGMESTARSFGEVVEGLGGLGSRTGELRLSMEDLVRSTAEVGAASAEIDRNSDQIRAAVEEIGRLSAENTRGFDEMVSGIREMGGAAEGLARLGQANQRNVDAIDEELGRFKTSEDLCGG